jgi:hypothetical protein
MKWTVDPMLNVGKTLAAGALALVLGAEVAAATTVHATSITVGSTTVTTQTNTTNRGDLGNALGASDATQNPSFRGFYSLGLGGSAVFGFGTNFGAPGAVIEVTSGSRSAHPESLLVEALNIVTGLWDTLGSISNQGPTGLTLAVSLPLQPGATYSLLRLTDTSPFAQGRDGWDIDSISVSAVPVPAAGLLLIGALGGLAALRRRKALAA